jgi:hypothetical protein
MSCVSIQISKKTRQNHETLKENVRGKETFLLNSKVRIFELLVDIHEKT